jgi:very-short-patch-repair endonuclease
MEREIKSYLTDVLGIEEDEIIMNDRNTIGRKELDIYIPTKKLAIELNGTYWHSFDHIPSKVEKEKHYTKMKECSDLGITLIQFWDDEWTNQKDICKDIIRRSLGQTQNVVHGRKTYVRKLTSKEAMDFMKLNHIQGGRSGPHRYGLFNKINDDLLSLMVFGKPRFRKDCDYELIRFCSKENYYVIGGIDKLFSAFLTENKKDSLSVVSYNDIRIFSGRSYIKLGFEKLDAKPSLDYYWVRNNKRYGRNLTQKHKLSEFLKDGIYDPKLSEDVNMLMNGYRKLYGCGQDCWIYKE